jgi:hypothetical protein
MAVLKAFTGKKLSFDIKKLLLIRAKTFSDKGLSKKRVIKFLENRNAKQK